jgi:hypothetical protein
LVLDADEFKKKLPFPVPLEAWTNEPSPEPLADDDPAFQASLRAVMEWISPEGKRLLAPLLVDKQPKE